jgi:hypothetical protein
MSLEKLQKGVKTYNSFKDDYNWLTKKYGSPCQKFYDNIFSGEFKKDDFDKWVDENFTDGDITDSAKKTLKAMFYVKTTFQESNHVEIKENSVDARLFLCVAKKDGSKLSVGIGIATYKSSGKDTKDILGCSNQIIKALKYHFYDTRGIKS